MDLLEFCKHIDYYFTNESLLLEALTHPSFAKKNPAVRNYQRLEFLGDKVLSLVISRYLINKYQDEDEGDLSKRHAALVSGATLSNIALDVKIDQVLRLSLGEENIGGKTNKRNLENALEALIGAIYLDSDYQNCEKFISFFWKKIFNENIAPPKDPVSQLQEIVQTNSKSLPIYQFQRSGGLEHSPIFLAKLQIPYLNISFEIEGRSKKEAQRSVAKVALDYIKNLSGNNSPLNNKENL